MTLINEIEKFIEIIGMEHENNETCVTNANDEVSKALLEAGVQFNRDDLIEHKKNKMVYYNEKENAELIIALKK